DLLLAEEVARLCVKYADRGIVGLGVGGIEAGHSLAPFARCLDIARDAGLGIVPHAGESAGPESIREALDLGAHRLRHGIRAVDDPALLAEIADREIVLDVCPTSNLRTRVTPSLDAHPLPTLVAAGALCSISTDDPAMFNTDLGLEHAVAARLGVTAEAAYRAGLAGALCDEQTRSRLVALGERTHWSG
ncbi:MAG: adenosine deaminase, partial [Micromonosporaceae bacterium]|nr:adenosine deaminase [Micromonosporaceae bacterium]